jgi:hypothetical protein
MASRRKSFMVGCIQYSRPETESDITMINGVASFISKVASQEQDTYLDYVLAWCSEFERAAREELHRARNPKPVSASGIQPVAIRPQGQMLPHHDYLHPNSFPDFFQSSPSD